MVALSFIFSRVTDFFYLVLKKSCKADFYTEIKRGWFNRLRNKNRWKILVKFMSQNCYQVVTVWIYTVTVSKKRNGLSSKRKTTAYHYKEFLNHETVWQADIRLRQKSAKTFSKHSYHLEIQRNTSSDTTSDLWNIWQRFSQPSFSIQHERQKHVKKNIFNRKKKNYFLCFLIN